jgi:phenylpropionate dioxygenase-like ring-hydroxylating dioxygenase large terminal subunit
VAVRRYAWTYDLEGRLRAAPRSEREPGLELEGTRLLGLRVETWGPLVFVNPDAEASPLADTLGPVPEHMAAAGSTSTHSASIGRTAGWFDYYFSEEVSDAEAEELIAFDDQVGAEDRRLVESVQLCIGSGLLDSGLLLPENERLLAHFQQLVREALA